MEESKKNNKIMPIIVIVISVLIFVIGIGILISNGNKKRS